jgi:hypothetical protein
MTIGDPGDQQCEGDAGCLAGQKAQRRVALQERILRAPNAFHLKEMICQGEHRRTGVFGGLGRRYQCGPLVRWIARQKINEVYSQFHFLAPFASRSNAEAGTMRRG